MTRFHIVVSERLGVILHIVDYVGSHIACLGVHIIIIVAGWLTLQDVAVLQEDDVVLVGFAQPVDVRGDARQGYALGLRVMKSYGKKAP